MISWIFNIVGLVAAWYYTDTASSSTFQNTICPIFVVVFAIVLLIKLALFSRNSGGLGPDGGGIGGYSGGGDGGGGDGGD